MGQGLRTNPLFSTGSDNVQKGVLDAEWMMLNEMFALSSWKDVPFMEGSCVVYQLQSFPVLWAVQALPCLSRYSWLASHSVRWRQQWPKSIYSIFEGVGAGAYTAEASASVTVCYNPPQWTGTRCLPRCSRWPRGNKPASCSFSVQPLTAYHPTSPCVHYTIEAVIQPLG